MSGDNSLRKLFPSSERIAIGGSDPRGTNTIERYTGKVSDPESLLLYVGFNTPGWLTP